MRENSLKPHPAFVYVSVLPFIENPVSPLFPLRKKNSPA